MNEPSHQGFPRSAALVLLGATLAGCSNSGGGGPTDSVPPVLISASFGGAGPGPVAGDLLLLFSSEDLRNAAGAEITDADLTLSGGATLGSGTMVTTQPTARSLRLTLGTGASFVPGTTTVQLAVTNNVIADLAGNLGVGGAAVPIDDGDGTPPTVVNLTVAAIDDQLNGTGPAGGTLQVPRSGWTIDLLWFDSGLGVDPARTRLTANVPVNTSSGSQAPGIDLAPFLTPVTTSATAGSYQLPSTTVFPPGLVTLTATVIDNGGLASTPVTYSFSVRSFTDDLQPFETSVNSQQVWFIDTSRDIESFNATLISGGIPGAAEIQAISPGNARSDFLDLLFVLGLQSTSPIPNVSGTDDSNTVVLDRFQSEMVDNLNDLFSGVNVTFTFTQPAGSFGGNSTVAYASLGYSQICLAGSSDTAGVLGIAQLDPSNARQNDNCILESAMSNRLGVFLHTIANAGLGSPAGSSFRQVFDNFAPVTGGTPIGDDAQDGQRLLGNVGDPREMRIDDALADLARFSAIVIAHECSHSMGLVINGPMPFGLYGNDPNFPGSTDGHIHLESPPSGGTNVMTPQLSYDGAINANTAFNSLNIAYLREQAFYGN